MLKQIVKFGFTGGISFIVDYSVLVFLTEILGLNYLVSNCLSFIISVIVNYILSMRFVFKSVNNNKVFDFIIFIVLSVIGLGLNSLIMFICTDYIGIHYMISKIGATGVVMIFNFVSRKVVYERDLSKRNK